MGKTKREQLEKLVHDIKQMTDDAESKGNGDFSAEDRQKVTDMLTEAQALKASMLEDAKLNGGIDELKGFLGDLAGKPAEPTASDKFALTQGGLDMRPKGKTFGQLFTESEQYGDFLKRYAGGNGGIIKDSTKGIQSAPFAWDGKALITGASSTSAGAFVVSDEYTSVTDLVGERELTVDDLVTKGNTTSDTIEYVRITGKTNNAAPVPEATSAALLASVEAGGVTDAAGGLKPESELTLERVSTTVKTVAHWMPMTKRAASDAAQVRTLVDNFLLYGLDEELEDQELNGDNTGENFQGIMNAVSQSVASAGTDIDAIVDGIRTVRVTGRRKPTAVVFHPNDWYSTGFLLAKDSAGNYLIGDPRASVEQLNTLWGLRVVVSEAQTENTALVGAFNWAVRWAREGATISVSDSHMDFFTRNLLAILAERRDAFGVLDVQAWCKVSGV
jgi:HK97 family phage major capsid protein